MLIFLTANSGIGFYWYNKYTKEIWEESTVQKSVTKTRSKFNCEIVLEFKKNNKFLWLKTSYHFGTSNAGVSLFFKKKKKPIVNRDIL